MSVAATAGGIYYPENAEHPVVHTTQFGDSGHRSRVVRRVGAAGDFRNGCAATRHAIDVYEIEGPGEEIVRAGAGSGEAGAVVLEAGNAPRLFDASRRRSGARPGKWAWPWSAALAMALLATSCTSTPDYLRDADAVNADLTIHVVIENPAGTAEKWEVTSDGTLLQERADGAAIEIPYLPWPFNAGMIPRTLLSAELGGDGEPCDVLVLGPALPRGTLVRAVPIGLLRIVDMLERDDKILAVIPGTPLGGVSDVDELEARFPGVRGILETWYTNARPGGYIDVQGMGSRAAAQRLIGECAAEFESLESRQAIPDWVTP